mmetsp:Transcript_4865/g.8466  ORF Transcript_4865/g.8466 Transcript_4865/m.8466 type:complete len:305 (-) Transcript_4865:165-1079(-)
MALDEQTIRFNRPTLNSSLEDAFRQTAALVLQRISVAMCGEYNYTFKNTARRAVKVHIMPASGGTEAEALASSIVVTIPGFCDEFKIPLKSASIMVSAGFERDDNGSCEIFWSLRRFDWEPTIIIQFRPEHSQEDDEEQGLPIIEEERSPASLELLAQATPPGGTLPPVGVAAGPMPEQPLPPTPEVDCLSARSFTMQSAHFEPMTHSFLARAMQGFEPHGAGPSMSVPLYGFDDIHEGDESEESYNIVEEDGLAAFHLEDSMWELVPVREAVGDELPHQVTLVRRRRRELPPRTTPPTDVMTF